MAEMVGKSGKVIGIDHIPELVEKSRQNIKQGNSDLLDSGRILLVTGDGRQGYTDGKYHLLEVYHPCSNPGHSIWSPMRFNHLSISQLIHTYILYKTVAW